MTPYVVWSESRSEFNGNIDAAYPDSVEVECAIEFQEELSDLIEQVIANLMSSSTVELRKVLGAMQKSNDEKRQQEQRAYLSKELTRIEDKTTAIVAEALLPVLTDLQRSRLVNEFASTLKKILPEFAGHLITVDAPVELHDKISHALKLNSIEAEVQTSNKSEIVVAGSHVVLRAELDLWARRLGEVATT
jgi:ABC-type anion transport system duplicated permease subunit